MSRKSLPPFSSAPLSACADAKLAALGFLSDPETENTQGPQVQLSIVPRPRLRLQDLASPSAQIETFGSVQWNQEFVRLREIDRLPGYTEQGLRLREKLWKELRAPKFKLFQEAFCHLDDWIIPKSLPTACSQIIPGDISVLACLASPEKIRPSLIEELQLIPRDFDSHLKLWARCSVVAVTSLKLFWDSMSPLIPGRHQVLVAHAPSSALQQYYPAQLPPCSPDAFGTLLTKDEFKAGTKLCAPGLPAYTSRSCSYEVTKFETLRTDPTTNSLSQIKARLFHFWCDFDRAQFLFGRNWRDAALARKREVCREHIRAWSDRFAEMLIFCEQTQGIWVHDLRKKLDTLSHFPFTSWREILMQLVHRLILKTTQDERNTVRLVHEYVLWFLQNLRADCDKAATLFSLDHYLFSLPFHFNTQTSTIPVGPQVDSILKRLRIDPAPLAFLPMKPIPHLRTRSTEAYARFEASLRQCDSARAQESLADYREVICEGISALNCGGSLP
jgi:hypothetical protein